MTLYDKLEELSKSDMLPLHMPGHKRSPESGRMAGIYGIDITEIDGFDDLHKPEGIIKEMEDQAARIYEAADAFVSVNGSTGANEAAILSVCSPGDKIIMSRGSHKSVYYAVEVGGLKPVYMDYRTLDHWTVQAAVTPEQVEEAMRDNPDCHCIVITSPTYEGIAADVGAIADIVHSGGGILIVDSAHGAHLGLSDAVPAGAISQGADLVIVSLHKMLPAPTQTALLLVNSDRVDLRRIRHYMSVFQSSSPSYVLMAGIGECLEYLEKSAANDISRAVSDIKRLTEDLSSLKYLTAEHMPGGDPFKMVIGSKTKTVTGRSIYRELLEKYHIQCEMYAEDYALALFSPMDGKDTFVRLENALRAIDGWLRDIYTDDDLSDDDKSIGHNRLGDFPKPKVGCAVRDAVMCDSEMVDYEKAAGRISAGYCMAYPPGIPMIVPGEIVDRPVIEYIRRGLETGLNMVGIEDSCILVRK